MSVSENDEPIEQTVVQDEAERLRSKDRSSFLSRPEVPGYEVETLLGAGSYGEVWLALQKNTGRKVAIKFFSRFKGLDWLIEASPTPTAHHRCEDVDRSLAEIVDRCLKKDPAERFQNVPQVIEALDLRERRRTRRPLVFFGLLGPLVLVLAMAGVGLWARFEAEYRATEALTQQTLESATGNAELIAAVVDRNLSAVQRRVEREAGQDVLESMVAGGGGRALQSHLGGLYEAYRDRYFHSWVVTDANAVVLARAPFDDRVVGARYAYREWFTGEEDISQDRAPEVARPRKKTGVTLAFESTAEGNPILVSVASPIRKGEETIGVLAATIHLETFNEWLAEAEGPPADGDCPNRFAVLLHRGQLVRHPCPLDETTKLPVARLDFAETPDVRVLVESESGQAREYRDPLRERGVFLAAFRQFRENEGWSAIVQHDRTQAMSPVTSLVRQFGNLGWVAAGVGVLLVMALWAMLYRVTREESLLPTRERLIGLDL